MSNNHLIRMAGRIHRQLYQPVFVDVEWRRSINELVSRLRTIEHQSSLSRQATQRGWHVAAAAKDVQIMAEVVRLEAAVSQLRYRPSPTHIQATATLGTIIAELQQLGNEFDDVEIDLKQGLIGVSTEPIVLEGITLGPFTIELHVNRLAGCLGSGSFRCVAVEPNPAASNDSIVHPHVQDGHLCTGKATVPLATALKEGRIADAFILVRSVLLNYNPDSPYVSLENWSGRDCGECGYLANSDGMYFCDNCEKDVCEDCYRSCDVCDQGCCRSCLELDEVSGNRCCAACRHTCENCDRIVDKDTFDEEFDLCPGCLAEQENKQEEHDHESEHSTCGGQPASTTQAAPMPETAPAAA